MMSLHEFDLTLWPRIGDVTASGLISSMKETDAMDKALDQLSDKLKKEQQKIVNGPKTILKYWDEPTKALRAGTSFLEPILSEKYDKWNLRKKACQQGKYYLSGDLSYLKKESLSRPQRDIGEVK